MAISSRNSRRRKCAHRYRRPLVEHFESRRLLALLNASEELSAAALDHESSEILVRFKPGGSLNGIADTMTGAAASKSYPFVPGLEVVPVQGSLSVDQALAAYRTRLDVLYAEPNYALKVDAVPNDTRFGELWGLHNTGQSGGTVDADIDAPEAWDIATGENTVVVGVIDTGVDYNHPDLAANMWRNPGEIVGNSIDDDGNGFIDDVYGYNFEANNGDPMDDHQHGTHVAGTIGGLGNNGLGVAGVNWRVQVMALKFLNAGGFGWASDAIEAINYATMMKLRGVNIKLTNNSWGGESFSQALQDAIAASSAAGMLFVAAAGNSSLNVDASASYPAGLPLDNIISVAASDQNDARASFSNWGAASVDLAAPGVSILSTTPGGSYKSFSGTSMAAPHVAGVAALAWSLAPTATYQTIRDAILAGVDPNNAFRAGGPNPVVTGGRLNAHGTLQALGFFVTSSVPAANAAVATPPAEYVINFSAPINAATLQASDFSVDGRAADMVALNSAKTAATFTFNVNPVTSQGPHVMHIAAGAIARDGNPAMAITEANRTFYYDETSLQFVSTVPAAGSQFTFPGPHTLEVNFNEPLGSASVQAGDLVLVGVEGATVSNVSLLNNNQTARFTISGAFAEGSLTASIAAGAISDRFANPNRSAFNATYYVDQATGPFGAIGSKLPLGSLIYEGKKTGVIEPAADSDNFTLVIDAGQTLSVVAVPATKALAPSIEIRNPAGTLLDSNTALAGASAILHTVPIATSGTYTITIGGVNSTIGAYTLTVGLNTALEFEASGGAPNNTPNTAQPIDRAATPLGGGASHLAVLGSIDTGPGGASEDFEGGVVPASFTTYSSNLFGQVRIFEPTRSGNTSKFALLMDSAIGNQYALNEAIYHVNLAGLTQANLSFSHIHYSDEENVLPSEFTGHENGDGVSISDDGNRWYTILNAPTATTWTTFSIDLAVAAAAAGMSLGPDFQIKFQQYDNYEWFTDGRAFDNIQVALPDPQDTYRFTLATGDALSVAATAQSGGLPRLELRDAAETVLATGLGGSTSVDSALQGFAVPASGDYFLTVTGPLGVSYSAVITRNADFSSEPNDTTAVGQSLLGPQLTGSQWVAGHVGSTGDAADFYRVNLASGATLTLETFLPASGSGEFVNALDPRLRILDAAGAPVASDENSADGRNALLSYMNSGGAAVFYVQVAPTALTAATSGEYSLRVSGNTLTPIAFRVTGAGPANGAVLSTPPGSYLVDFNDAYLATSVQASDLIIDGVHSATGVTLVDGDTIRFTLPPLGIGSHTLSLATIVDIQGTPLAAHTSTLSINTLAPKVTATSLAPGGIAAPGAVSYEITFHKPMQVVSADAFALKGNRLNITYAANSFSFNAEGTVLTLNFADLPDDDYTLTLLSDNPGGSKFTDPAGNALDGEFSGAFPSGDGFAGGDLVMEFSLDRTTSPFPSPLVQQSPAGSLVNAATVPGSISPANDTDSFTLALDSNQTITVLVTPVAGTLQSIVEVRNPAGVVLGSMTAGAPGGRASLQTLPATAGGIYTITVNGASSTTGAYSIGVTLNAALERESIGGAANETAAAAENINSAFSSLPGFPSSVQRAAVLGTAGATLDSSDYYSLTLAAGDVVTISVTNLGTPFATVDLRSASNVLLATGSYLVSNVERVIKDFQVTTAGTYYVRVQGILDAPYNLLITKNAAFDRESNDGFATAQALGAGRGVLGALGTPTTSSIVFPNSMANHSFGSGNAMPFGMYGVATSARYQQFFPKGEFGPGGLITALRYRNWIYALPFSQVADMKMNLGYAANRFDSPSTTFANNVKSSVTVFDGAAAFSSSSPNTNPQPFDIVFNLTTPFRYDPSQGDLLLEVFMRNAPNTTGFDSVRLYWGQPAPQTTRVFANNIDDTTGLTDWGGLVTRFDITPVVEEDWYQLNVTSTASILLTTSTPGDGPGQFVNELNPHLELYDPENTLVASGVVAADGRNETLLYQPLSTGNYRVRVSAEGATRGEYTLQRKLPPIARSFIASTQEERPLSFSLGAMGEPPDTLTFRIISPPLHGSLSGTGTNLTYTPKKDFNGFDRVIYEVFDGLAASEAATVSLIVSPVNDPPSFQPGLNEQVTDESGPQSLFWALSIDKGPLDEVSQSVAFHVDVDRTDLFTSQPIVDREGMLKYTAAPNKRGIVTVTVTLQDDGGTANGGSDTSGPQTFTIEIIKPRPWHNAVLNLDVTADGHIAPDDALSVIDYLNAFGSGPVPAAAAIGPLFYDTVNHLANPVGDNFVTPGDVLVIINHLNALRSPAEGESVLPAITSSPPPSTVSLDVLDLLAADLATQPRRRR